MSPRSIALADVWHHLRQLTPARIALGRAGGSLPTAELLDFQLAHARARDAVHAPFDAAALAVEIEQVGFRTVCLASAAADHDTFLKRPDLGRRLSAASRLACSAADNADPAVAAGIPHVAPAAPGGVTARRVDLAIIVSDGLSALAVERQAPPLLAAWLPLIREANWHLAPLAIVERGRVAVEDEIGEAFDARAAVILIGERPGLGSPDSLGAYLVLDPRPGRTDADRNCVSNIRPQGLPPAEAALKLHYLTREALQRGLSGIALKDESISISANWQNNQLAGEGGGQRDEPRA